jgi:membrane fusion protein (multidrug efflux system)
MPLAVRALTCERRPPARAALAAALGLLALLGACGSRDKGFGGPPPAVVEVVKVEPRPFRNVVEFVGQLNSEESVMVNSEVAGIIEAIPFQEGAPVEKGQVLFELRDDVQRAELAGAEARMELTADVLRRTEMLAKREISATAELDRARAEHRVAAAEVERARVRLDRTLVRAPFEGLAGARLVSPGDRVTPRTNLVPVDKVDRLQLVFTVPEVGVSVLRMNQKLSVRVAPFPDQWFEGETFFIAPSLDPRTRRFLVKAWIPNPNRAIRPGMFANVKLELEYKESALLVPESAIVYDAQGPFVWRVKADDTAERASVSLGLHKESNVLVESGLSAGDRIVSAGTNKVIPGGALVIKDARDGAAPAAGPEPKGAPKEGRT